MTDDCLLLKINLENIKYHKQEYVVPNPNPNMRWDDLLINEHRQPFIYHTLMVR